MWFLKCFITIILLLSLNNIAAAQSCGKREGNPVVDIHMIDNGVHYQLADHNEIISQASGLGVASATIKGLTKVTLSSAVSYKIVTMTNGVTTCSYPAEVSIDIGYKDPQNVYIDNKYPVGSCQYNAILNHENGHVNLNQQTLQILIPYLKNGLIEAINHKNYPIQVPNKEWANQEIQKNLSALFASFLEAHEKQRHGLNAMLDTPENYAATTRLCSFW